MTIPLNDLLVSIRWQEEGKDVPARVQQQLALLAQQQAALARTAALGPGGAAPPGGGPPSSPLGLRNRFQSDWASTREIMAAMARDAGQAAAATRQLGNAIQDVGPKAVTTTRTIGHLRTAVATAAFSMAGMAGTAGRVVSGLLLFAGGTPVVLAVAVAVGTLALAFRGLTADVRANKAAQEELVRTLATLGPNAQGLSIRMRIAELERLRDEPGFWRRVGRGARGIAREGPLQGVQNEQVRVAEEINREIARLRGEEGRAGLEFTEPGREAVRDARFAERRAAVRFDALGRGRLAPMSATRVQEQLDILEGEYRKLSPAVAREVAARKRAAAEADLLTDATMKARQLGDEAALRRRMIGAPALAITEAMRRTELLRSGVSGPDAIRIAREERGAAASMQTTDVLRTMGPQLAVQSILAAQRGGGAGFAGTFFPGAAGLAAALPGVGRVAGAAINLAGGLLGGLFDKTQDKHTQRIVDAIERMGKEVGLERVTLVFTGPGGHQIRTTLDALEGQDGVERIPGPPGSQG